MACGETGPLDGGLIRNSTIQSSSITDSTFTGGTVRASDVDSCELKNLASCDAPSARTIASAMADDASAMRDVAEGIVDDPNAVSTLAAAVLGGNPSAYASPAGPDAGSDLPTDVFGSRDAVLCRPAAWMQFGDYVVPLYRKA